MTTNMIIRNTSSNQVPLASETWEWGQVLLTTATRASYLQSVRPIQEVIDEMLLILPPLMSEQEVAQLRIQYPPLSATGDPATFEFGGV